MFYYKGQSKELVFDYSKGEKENFLILKNILEIDPKVLLQLNIKSFNDYQTFREGHLDFTDLCRSIFKNNHVLVETYESNIEIWFHTFKGAFQCKSQYNSQDNESHSLSQIKKVVGELLEQETEFLNFKEELGTLGLRVGQIMLKMDFYDQKEESDSEDIIIEISQLKRINVLYSIVQGKQEEVYFQITVSSNMFDRIMNHYFEVKDQTHQELVELLTSFFVKFDLESQSDLKITPEEAREKLKIHCFNNSQQRIDLFSEETFLRKKLSQSWYPKQHINLMARWLF